MSQPKCAIDEEDGCDGKSPVRLVVYQDGSHDFFCETCINANYSYMVDQHAKIYEVGTLLKTF